MAPSLRQFLGPVPQACFGNLSLVVPRSLLVAWSWLGKSCFLTAEGEPRWTIRCSPQGKGGLSPPNRKGTHPGVHSFDLAQESTNIN